MAFTNYTTLQAALADWLNRTDLTATIPDFVALTESELNRRLRHWRMLETATATASSQYTSLPSDWLEGVRVSVATTPERELEYVTPREMADLRSVYTAGGVPKFYTIAGSEIEVIPSPDSSYTLNLMYYEQIPDLASNSTNWVLTNHPDIYLYGPLLQAAPYLHNDERVVLWQSRFEKAMEELRVEGDNGQISGQPKMRFRSLG